MTNHPKTWRFFHMATDAVVLLAAIASFFVLLFEQSPPYNSNTSWVGFFISYLWSIAAYAMIFFVNSRLNHHRAQGYTLLGASLFIAVLGLGVYIDTFYIKHSVEHGFVMIFIPTCQIVIAIIAIVLTLMIRKQKGD